MLPLLCARYKVQITKCKSLQSDTLFHTTPQLLQIRSKSPNQQWRQATISGARTSIGSKQQSPEASLLAVVLTARSDVRVPALVASEKAVFLTARIHTSNPQEVHVFPNRVGLFPFLTQSGHMKYLGLPDVRCQSWCFHASSILLLYWNPSPVRKNTQCPHLL